MPATHEPPSFQFYPRDWIVDTRHLTREERGRYWDALCESWVSRSYGVAGEEQWREWLGYPAEEWPAVRQRWVRFFVQTDDGDWVQQRMVEERDRQRERHQQARRGGLLTQQALASRRAPSPAPAQLEPAPAPAPARVKAASKVRAQWRAAFDQFWVAHPKRVGKAAALAVWDRLQPASEDEDDQLFNAIMDGLEVETARWREEKREERYIPDPRTWLNQKRWVGLEEVQ